MYHIFILLCRGDDVVTSLVKREVAGSNPAGGAGGVRRDTPVMEILSSIIPPIPLFFRRCYKNEKKNYLEKNEPRSDSEARSR